MILLHDRLTKLDTDASEEPSQAKNLPPQPYDPYRPLRRAIDLADGRPRG
ncbi:MAG TPA: hypothetical protein VHL77_09135 [Ferruginibacter sp.]|nr:hypothetical protein [Ferruginibacter sp.]